MTDTERPRSMTDMEATDEEIAASVQKGDAERYGILMGRYEAKLARYGRRFLQDPDDLTALVQDIFVKAYRNIQSFDTAGRFSPWIYRIAHNEFVSELRRRGSRPALVSDFDTLLAHAPAADTDTELRENAEMRSLIDRGLSRLPLPHWEVIVLYYFEGLRYEDIADVLKVPIGTVAARLSRAKAALKKAAPELTHAYGT